MDDNSLNLTVLLVPKNPLGMPEEELQPLATELVSEGFNVRFAGREQRGYGVTWWEVLTIYVLTKGADAVTGHAFELLIEKLKNKATACYGRRREEQGTARPFSLQVRDADGKLIKAFNLTPDGKVEETKDASSTCPPPEPPEDSEE